MAYKIVEGQVLAAKQAFVDDETGDPILASAGYPKVWLKRGAAKLASMTAAPESTPGEWAVNVPVPTLGLEDVEELDLVWILRTPEDDKHRVVESVFVSPKVESRAAEVIHIAGDADFEIVLPVSVLDTDYLGAQLYDSNKVFWNPAIDLTGSSAVTSTSTRTQIVLSGVAVPDPSLSSYLLRLDHRPQGARARNYSFKFWSITPQIMLAMSHLEDFLNKSRIENVIPELEYTPSDLLGYLERGLYLFNTVFLPTAFSGTNMQGPLFNVHLLCSQYYALCAQLLAEGSLSFDFSGQGISLNVDRTPSLESALGRVEQQINEQIPPLKKHLSKQNILGGDGSVGATSMRNSRSIGMLGLTNAPTTRLHGGGGPFMGRRS